MQTFVPAVSNKYGYSGLSTQTNRVHNNVTAATATNLPAVKDHVPKDIFFSAGNSDTGNADKRKAQNRASQRAFRERKEKKAKDLEQRVEELTRETAAKQADNQHLRERLAQGTEELEVYKTLLGSLEEVTTTPNFSFPPHSFKTGFPGLSYESKGSKNHLSPGESKFLPATEFSNPWAKK